MKVLLLCRLWLLLLLLLRHRLSPPGRRLPEEHAHGGGNV